MENKKELNEEKLTSLKDETVEDVAGGFIFEAAASVGVAADAQMKQRVAMRDVLGAVKAR